MSDDEVKSSKYKKGIKIRRNVLGDKHVDASLKNSNEFDNDFQTHITETAWGSAWSRDGILSYRDRSLLTLAILATSGHEQEFKLHLRATKNTGVTKEEVREMLIHLSVYAGVPAANHYVKVAKEVYAELEEI